LITDCFFFFFTVSSEKAWVRFKPLDTTLLTEEERGVWSIFNEDEVVVVHGSY